LLLQVFLTMLPPSPGCLWHLFLGREARGIMAAAKSEARWRRAFLIIPRIVVRIKIVHRRRVMLVMGMIVKHGGKRRWVVARVRVIVASSLILGHLIDDLRG